MAKTPFPKTAIAAVTPANLPMVVEQMRQVLLEIQGGNGPAGLRSVRVEELIKIGLLRDTPNGLILGYVIENGGGGGGGGSVNSVSGDAPVTSTGGTDPHIGMPAATAAIDGYLTSTDFTAFDAKQDPISLTTTGTSGAATFIGNVLNIPNYSAGTGATIKDTSTARPITLTDNNAVIEFTHAGAITVTVSGLIAFPQGFNIVVFCSDPTGQVTFVGTNGMTITSSDSLKTRTQYSPVGLYVDDTNEATLSGDIEAIAPAVSIMARAANSVGAPDWLIAGADGDTLQRVAGVLQFAPPALAIPLDTTLSYIGDQLDVVTTSLGTKTMVYTGDKLTAIIGTGAYKSKNFTYTGDLLTGIDVL